jgi:ABC-2 type transport system permease protein
LQLFVPVDLSHFLGGCLQLVTAFLLLCLLGNEISIFSPIRLRENGLKAANASMMTFIGRLFALVAIPITLTPLLIPAVVDFSVRQQAWAQVVPGYLILHALGTVGTFLLYRRVIRRQGDSLQDQERRILEVLTRE